MRVVILAGGQGTRLGSLTDTQPKPLVTVGGKPLVWHLLEKFRRHGWKHSTLAIGHLGERFAEHFGKESRSITYPPLASSGSESTPNELRGVGIHDPDSLPNCHIDLLFTGQETQTGGRVKRLSSALVGNESFCLTYGDGLSNVDLSALERHHKQSHKMVTVTAVRPPARFGCITFDLANHVRGFDEKPMGSEGWINGGFMIAEPAVLDEIEGDHTVFEHVLSHLAERGELAAYRHHGFWQCMDTTRDRKVLEDLWIQSNGEPPWLSEK